jgi:hypothetical protein
MKDSSSYVANLLRYFLVAVTTSDWDALDKVTIPLVGTQGAVRTHWRKLLTSALIGVTPAVLLGIFRALGLFLPLTIAPYLVLAAYGWAAVSLLVSLDPFFEKRISLVGEVLQLIRGSSKEK